MRTVGTTPRPTTERRRFGPSRREVAVIGQGTWYLERVDRASAIAALRRGLDLGMTHIDTAEMYGSGTVEGIVGEAIAGRRDEVFLVSKVLPQNASQRATVAACERSLARLGTDRLDCYLLHWREETPLEETFSAFEQLLRDGKILSCGVSNFDVADLNEAWTSAGDGGFVCNQVLYHLQERAIEHAALMRLAEMDAKRIKIEVQGNNVILTGTVRSWAEKQEAERAAYLAPGVVSVDNQIAISV